MKLGALGRQHVNTWLPRADNRSGQGVQKVEGPWRLHLALPPDLSDLIHQAMCTAVQSKHNGLAATVCMTPCLAIIRSAVDLLGPCGATEDVPYSSEVLDHFHLLLMAPCWGKSTSCFGNVQGRPYRVLSLTLTSLTYNMPLRTESAKAPLLRGVNQLSLPKTGPPREPSWKL